MPNPKEVDTYVKFEFPYPSVSNTLEKGSLYKKNLVKGLIWTNVVYNI